MTSQRYQWRLLHAVPRSHRWFIDELTGGVACADRSGSTPDQTEDGVLWLDKTRYIKMTESHDTKVKVIACPVISDRTSKGSLISCNLAELLYLMRSHGMELRIEAGEDNGEHFTV